MHLLQDQFRKQIESAKQQLSEALKQWTAYSQTHPAIPSDLADRVAHIKEAQPFLTIWDDLSA